MVEYHIERYPQSFGMQSGNHFAEFDHSCIRIGRICTETSLKGKELFRIISPVIAPLRMCLIHCQKVHDRLKLHMRDAELPDMIEAGRNGDAVFGESRTGFRKAQEAAAVLFRDAA